MAEQLTDWYVDGHHIAAVNADSAWFEVFRLYDHDSLIVRPWTEADNNPPVVDLRDAEDIIDDIETAYIPASIQDEDIRAALFEAYRQGYLAGNAESTPF